MSPSLSWFERDELFALLQQVGLPERRAAEGEAPPAPLPLDALGTEGSYEVTVDNRFRSLANVDAGRFASSASTQPGPVPPSLVEDDFDKKATRLAAGQPAPPMSFPQGGPPPAKAPHTEDGPPPEPRKRHSEWGGAAAAHRELAQGGALEPLGKPAPRQRGKRGGTITAPPSSSDPLSEDFPDSSDVASSRPEQIPAFVAPLGPVELRLEALLQWCIGLGAVAGGLQGAAVADQEGLPLAVKVLPRAGAEEAAESPREAWLGGALEVALGYLESDGPIREGRLSLQRVAGPLTVLWVPSVQGQRWYLILWGDDAPRDRAVHIILDAFRELSRRAGHEVETS